uniref:hypothetical protein n=1 Tax=Streptococcus pluranimalium TaxID=82348 RepID=UPI003F68DDAD
MGSAANNAIYYLIVGAQIVIGLIILFSAITWGIADQTKNLKLKKWAGIFFFIFTSIFYVMRVGSISLFAGLKAGEQINIGVSLFRNTLRLIQLIFLSVIPSFFLIEAYIFKYQNLIIDHPDSKANVKKYMFFALALPVIVALVLQLMISLL